MHAIAIIPNNINRDEQVRFYRADDGRNDDTIDLFDTAQDAQDAIDEICTQCLARAIYRRRV